MKLQVIAAALVAAPSALGDLCSTGDQLLTIETKNSWCDGNPSGGNDVVALDSCCAGGGGGDTRRLLEIATGTDVRTLQTPECRTIMTDKSYCNGDARCEQFLGSGDVMTLDLTLTNLGAGESCCKSCTCYGDPECTSFSGEKDEWILCDGRNENTCVVTEKKCLDKKDHKENQCLYIRDTPAWVSFEESGSPCQPDFSVSGYAEMVMYEVNGFKVLLFLGERGVIVDMQVTLSSGQQRTLNAATCAWTGGSLPSSWKSRDILDSSGNVVETSWTVDDEDLGIFVTAACTTAIGATKRRIDVRSLIETVEERAGATGVCIAGNITEKGRPRIKEKLMHERCLAENLPGILVACKRLVDDTCQEHTINDNMEKWCENADLNRASVGGVAVSSVETCKSMLLNGSNKARTAAWTEMVCSINQDEIEQCTSLISQFGWSDYLSTKSNGATFGDSNTVANPSCQNSVSAYTTRSGDSCQEGVAVEYLVGNTWTEAFFIPALQPPCGTLSVTAETHPELFKYPVRVSQCDLNPSCLIENECRQAQGFEVSINFETDECPCPDPVIAGTEVKKVDLFEVYTAQFTATLEGQVCGTDSNLFQIGCGSSGRMPLKVNVKECDSADATTSTVEVLVGIQGRNQPVRCTLNTPMEIGTEYDVEVSVGNEVITVTVDGNVACTETFSGLPIGGLDQCVYESAPSMTAANACVEVDVASTGTPTQSPTCGNVLSEDNQVDTAAVPSTGFTSTATITLAGVNECADNEETNNIVRVGCEEGDDAGMIYSIDVECGAEDDTSGTARIYIGVEDSNGNDLDPIVCTVNNGLPVDQAVTVTTTVNEEKDYTISVDGNIECSGNLGNTELKTSQDACVYQSGPEKSPAYVCGLDFEINPELCENILIPGTQLTPVTGLNSAGYDVNVDIKLAAATCNQGNVNIYHFGCDEKALLSIDTNCDGDAIVTVGLEGGANRVYRCTAQEALVIDENVLVTASVSAADNKVTVAVNGNVICEESPTRSVLTPTENEDVCVYTSAPGRLPAYACEVTPDYTCASLLSQDNQVDTVAVPSTGFTSTATVTLGGVKECAGTEETNNIVRVGCEEGDDAGMIYSIDVECGAEDDTSGTARIYIGIEDSNGNDLDPIVCTVNNGLPVDQAVTVTTTVNENKQYTVSVDGKQSCSGQFPAFAELKTSQEACVYQSGPEKSPAYACGLEFEINPELCENVLEADRQLSPVLGLTSAGYIASVDVKLAAATCNEGDVNIVHLGCDEKAMFAVDTNCDGDAIVSVGIIGSNTPYTCTVPAGLVIDENVLISARVAAADGQVTVSVAGETICDEQLPGPAMTPSENEQVCLYASAPDRTPAYVCELNTAFTGLGEVCQCRNEAAGAKICDEAGERSIGQCDECCPDLESTVVDDRAPVCRSLMLQEPYCDPSSSSERNLCTQLSTNRGNGMLTLNMNLKTDTTTTCCHNCICYGDPECETFFGVESKWILCDGRDSKCKVTEEVCTMELDHMGKNCSFHPEIAALLENNRADIGAYGSPCLADFSTEAFMTMYSVTDFKARISMGERGVIEKLELTVAAGTYTLIADECYEATQNNLDAAWEYANGLDPLTTALDINMYEGPGANERTMEITDPNTKIFIRAVCIKQTSRKADPRVTSYRLNINNLVETNSARALAAKDVSDTGYCAQSSGEIETGLSTTSNTDAIYEECLMDLPDAHLFCKLVWSPSCTNEQVPIGVERWCQNANLLSRNVNECKNYIGTNAMRWQELYCESVSAQRDPTMGLSQWKKNCMAELATAGYFETVRAYGTGTFFDERASSNVNELCGSSTASYGKQLDSCVPGVVVETLNDRGNWVEEFFIPVTLPPCGGSLQISAKDHYNLFTRPIRFRQCEVDAGSCSIDASCLPMYELGMTYEFTQSDSVCPARRALRGD